MNEEETTTQFLGAIDIVEAFTALRHDLKLQVRHGKELQESLDHNLQRIHQRLVMLANNSAPAVEESDGNRKFAETIADVEESLQRAVDSFTSLPTTKASGSSLLQIERVTQKASWWTRIFAKAFLKEVRKILEEEAVHQQRFASSTESIRQGLLLLLARIQRLMAQSEIERVDVLNEPFNAETMHAVDVIDAPTIASSHVAEQIRPAYVWQGKLLRCADVRLAR